MDESVRATLSHHQAQVLGALLRGASPPAGFDAGAVALAGRGLARKRARSVAKAWPRMAGALAGRFQSCFSAYAAAAPAPPAGGPVADGWKLAQWLAARGDLPDEGRLELAHVSLLMRWEHRSESLVPRRPPAMVITRLHRPPRLVIGLRFIGRHQLWLRIPLAVLRARPALLAPDGR